MVYECLFETLLSILLDTEDNTQKGYCCLIGYCYLESTFIVSSVAAAPCYTPVDSLQGFISSPTLVFQCSHLNGCEVIFHCDFDLHFPNSGVASFHMLSAQFCIFGENVFSPLPIEKMVCLFSVVDLWELFTYSGY